MNNSFEIIDRWLECETLMTKYDYSCQPICHKDELWKGHVFEKTDKGHCVSVTTVNSVDELYGFLKGITFYEK